MNSEKAWYWIAVATVAVMLGNGYLSHSAPRLQCLAQRSIMAARQAGEGVLAQLDRAQDRVSPVAPVTAADVAEIRAQALANVQVELMQHQADLAQLRSVGPQLAEVRVLTRSFRQCPRRTVQVHTESDDGTL